MLHLGKERYGNDGLKNLQYSVVNHIENILYTLIQVRLWNTIYLAYNLLGRFANTYSEYILISFKRDIN